jgi:copper chaperone CopZ
MNKGKENNDSEIRVEPIYLFIAGMTCASCPAKIEKALASVPGVSQAAVNFAADFTDSNRQRYPNGISK